MIQFIVVSSFFLQDYISFIFPLVFFFLVFFFGVVVFLFISEDLFFNISVVFILKRLSADSFLEDAVALAIDLALSFRNNMQEKDSGKEDAEKNRQAVSLLWITFEILER